MTDLKKQVLTVVILSVVIVLARVFPHAANSSPVLALFLLMGRLGRLPSWLLLAPLAALVVSDFWLGTYTGFLFVHLPLFGLIMVGRYWGSQWSSALFSALSGSLIFFVISNFGVWWAGEIPLYTADLQGLLTCYQMALPFFRATVESTLLWVGLAHATLLFATKWQPMGMRA